VPAPHTTAAQIGPLTSLRLLAALWTVIYTCGHDVGWRQASGLIDRGDLGVDLFFILSGFILAHVYGAQALDGRLNHGSFLWARLARIYPMHVITLIGLCLMLAGAAALGIQPDGVFDPGQLWAQVLLLHAWGPVEPGHWNHASWSISAEWLAYLLFPLLITLARRSVPTLATVAFGAAGFAGLSLAVPLMPVFGGAGLTDLTGNGGALRILPSFVLGIGLWRLHQGGALPVRWCWPLAGIALIWIIVMASARWPDVLVWIGFGVLILALAGTARTGACESILSHRYAQWWGEASYAIYMVHVPVLLLFSGLSDVVAIAPATVAGVAVASSVIVGGVLHRWFDGPARAWLRRHDPFTKAAPEQPA
jgi:peptidoglycan/LPS O-acetylase OafA/YrhL